MHVPARKVARNDHLFCEACDRYERVTMVRPYTAGRVFIRTANHDTFPMADAVVEIDDWVSDDSKEGN